LRVLLKSAHGSTPHPLDELAFLRSHRAGIVLFLVLPNAAARERASNPQAGFEMGYTEGQRKIVAAPTIAVAALILAGAASASAQN